MTDRAPIALGLFLMGHGHNVGSWRSSPTPAQDLLTLDHYRRIAVDAERGRMDMIFFAEILYSYELAGRHEGALAFPTLDPFVLIPALSAVTQSIGFVGTYSTSYTDPVGTARKLATIDRLNGGRTGWNIVTTGADQSAANFSPRQHPGKAERYALAYDYVASVRHQWQAMPPLPQGEPVRVQAGMSADGKGFAATVAEVMFTIARAKDDAVAFRTSMREALTATGRDPADLRIMPGIAPILGGTVAEARQAEERYLELLHPRIQLAMLGDQFGMDFSGYALDAPLPMDDIRQAPKVLSGARDPDRLINADGGVPTLGDYLRSQARVRAHHSFVGTPEQLADQLDEWTAAGACDGFNLMFPVQAEGVSAVVDHVSPLLQRRGLLRTDYRGSTLRHHLGLNEPTRETMKV
ncbi:MAG: LLM class flavin-dependent oxidoreductase [Sphingobium sp.]